MKISLLFLFSILATGTAFARIGETPAELDARYGAPVAQGSVVTKGGKLTKTGDADAVVRLKDGIYVETRLIRGRCAWIRFTKKAAVAVFSAPETKGLMLANGKSWSNVTLVGNGPGSYYVAGSTEDNTLSAGNLNGAGEPTEVEIFTHAWAMHDKEVSERRAADRRAAGDQNAKAAVKGF